MARLDTSQSVPGWSANPQATGLTAPAAMDATTPCPKCKTIMVLAAITPHPIVKQMERHTFLCYACNQTKSYMLRAD